MQVNTEENTIAIDNAIDEFNKEAKTIKTPESIREEILKKAKPGIRIMYKKNISIAEITASINLKLDGHITKKITTSEIKKILKHDINKSIKVDETEEN